MVTMPRLSILLGGAWHEFEAFGAWAHPAAAAAGFEPVLSYDIGQLERLEVDGVDVLLLYNCLDESSETAYADSQITALSQWLRNGGRLLALHSASVAARQNLEMRALIGGAFTGHPPIGTIDVKSIGEAHPIVGDVAPFAIFDELYRHDLEPSVTVHWVATDGEGEHPVAWSHRVERGRVAYLALGHDARAWKNPAFERIFRQTLRWLWPAAAA